MKKNNICVSILVPVYNTQKYLRKCLDTLVGQTLKEIEIICVNDGSTDDSLSILQEYAKRDNRIIIIDKPNGGLPSARNAGLFAANGEYVGFVDSDDYVETNMFQKMYKVSQKDNSEVVICGAHVFPSDPKPTEWIENVLSPRKVKYKTFTADVLFEENGARPFLWRNLIKLDLIKREELKLDEEIVIGEDQAFQFKVFPKAKGISFIPDKLYHYCWWRPGSIMNSAVYAKRDRRVYAHLELVKNVFRNWEKADILSSMSKEFLEWSIEFLYGDFIRISLLDRVKVAKEIMHLWKGLNCYKYIVDFNNVLKDMFGYFEKISLMSIPEKNPFFSIIVNVPDRKEDFEECRDSLKSQTYSNFEVVLINSGCGSFTYGEVHKFLMSDSRIRLINDSFDNVSSVYNLGQSVAVGKYLIFIGKIDRLVQTDVLSNLSNICEKTKPDVIYCDPLKNFQTTKDIGNEKISVYDLILKNQFLKEKGIVFQDFNLMSLREYSARCITETNNVYLHEERIVSKRKEWRRDWLYKEETNLMLEGYLNAINAYKNKKNDEHSCKFQGRN